MPSPPPTTISRMFSPTEAPATARREVTPQWHAAVTEWSVRSLTCTPEKSPDVEPAKRSSRSAENSTQA